MKYEYNYPLLSLNVVVVLLDTIFCLYEQT